MNKITQITRRHIFDAMQVEGIDWAGRLDETAFLSRLYDLEDIPSTDSETQFHWTSFKASL